MTDATIFIGIDVAKASLGLAMRPAGASERLPNDEAGIAQIVARLQTLQPTSVVQKAAGGLEVPLVSALGAADLTVAVVNPRLVRDFATVVGRLAETDALDAHLRALCGGRPPSAAPVAPRRGTGPLGPPGTPPAGDCRAGRRAAAPADDPPCIALAGRESHVAWLCQKRDDLDGELRRQVRQSAAWREDDDLLQSVPGIGPVVATTLIAFFSMRRFVWP